MRTIVAQDQSWSSVEESPSWCAAMLASAQRLVLRTPAGADLTSQLPAVSLDDVIITDELARRPSRAPDHEAENRALVKLASAMASSPKSVLQQLAEAARELCGAGSAGISVWEPGGEEVFRWQATAGEYGRYLGEALPRYFSPCGAVLERNRSLLMADPERFYPYISELCSPVREVLLVPFLQDGMAVGTVWVVAHDGDKHFDAEDARVVTTLTKFASAAFHMLSRMDAAERAERGRRQREEHLRALVAAASDVIYRMSADWSELQPLVGHDLVASNQVPIRGWLEKNLPACEHARVRSAIAASIAEKKLFELEHQVIRPDGSAGWTFSRAVPVLDDAGEIIEWVGAASDVTRRRAAEEALRAADRRKDDFLVTLAHELRNSLAPVSMGVTLLQDDPRPEAKRPLAAMRRQLGHMVRLVDDLMDISRIAQGKMELRRERVSLHAVVEAALELSRPHLERANHALHKTLPAEAPVVDADPIRLAQVLSNLLNNAAKYTPAAGEIRLAVRVAGAQVEIEVRDTGIGIPEERLAEVFNMFNQLGEGAARAQGGLGIGLALVRSLVEMHGGTVAAASAGADQGSTFTVRLPVLAG